VSFRLVHSALTNVMFTDTTSNLKKRIVEIDSLKMNNTSKFISFTAIL